MIEYNKFVLENGLRVLHHFDADCNNAILNVLYNVGARDEEESHTGFAHLFEHLMFGGSINIKHYDREIELSGGSNNAYTTNDLTNYYISLPVENIETAFWLESDRMLSLDFSQESLDIQKGVVIEEFKQRCFNAPFGLLWHHVRNLLYKNHPYKWPTIGLEISHIQDATLDLVKSFYFKHYHPENAVVVVAGNIDIERTKELSKKWFESIAPRGVINKNKYTPDSPILQRQLLKTEDLSPNNAVFICWRGAKYMDIESIGLEMFADMLGGNETSILHQACVKKSGLFNAAESFYMRSAEEGIFMIYGILNDTITHEDAEKMLLELTQEYLFHTESDSLEYRLQLSKNKARTSLLLANTNLMNKAQKLAFYENMGDANLANTEALQYQSITLSEVLHAAKKHLNFLAPAVVFYSPKTIQQNGN